MKIGDKVIVVSSPWSGVNKGDEGKIECVKDDGFGVSFTKIWPMMVSHVKPEKETRTLFFLPKHIKVIE